MPDFDTWTRLLLEPGRERNLLRANSSGLPFNSGGEEISDRHHHFEKLRQMRKSCPSSCRCSGRRGEEGPSKIPREEGQWRMDSISGKRACVT